MSDLLVRPIGGFGDKKREEIGRNCCWFKDVNTRRGFFYDAGVLVRRLEDQERRRVDINPSRDLLRECIERDGAHAQAVVVSHAHQDHLGAVGSVSNYVLYDKPRGYKLTQKEEDSLIPAVMSRTSFQFLLQVCYNNARQKLLKSFDEDSDEYRRQFGCLVWNSLPYNFRDGYELPKERQYVKHRSVLHVGGFDITFFEVNHSIPETFWIVMEGYGKRIVFCSDFRLAGFRPEEDKTRETVRAIAARGPIDHVFMDALYSSVSGFTGSEYETVGEIERIAKDRLKKGKKVILTYHASNLRLMAEFYQMAERLKKGPMALIGRSMLNSARISGLQSGPPDSSWISSFTGCQAEGGDAPSALVRGARHLDSDHVVIFASGAIPGNEEAIRDLVYQLDSQGVEVVLNSGEREHLAEERCEIPRYCYNIAAAHTHESGHEKADGKKWVLEQFAATQGSDLGRRLTVTPYHGGRGDYKAFVENVVPHGVEVALLYNGETLMI